MIETEAKFSVPDSITFDALRRLTRVGPFELQPLGVKHVTDHYLDTADRRFLAANYACRLRKSGDKQIATLKSLTPASDAVHRRQEIEAEVPSAQPESWPGSQVKTMVQEISARQELVLLFVIKQTRYKFQTLLAGQPVIEFSLDEVYLTEDGPVDYLELEAELIGGGTEETLAQFVAGLQAELSLPAERRSKFERAFETTQK